MNGKWRVMWDQDVVVVAAICCLQWEKSVQVYALLTQQRQKTQRISGVMLLRRWEEVESNACADGLAFDRSTDISSIGTVKKWAQRDAGMYLANFCKFSTEQLYPLNETGSKVSNRE